jgi:hypothetical protein
MKTLMELLHLTLNDNSAAPCASPAAPGPAVPVAADEAHHEGGKDAAHFSAPTSRWGWHRTLDAQ